MKINPQKIVSSQSPLSHASEVRDTQAIEAMEAVNDDAQPRSEISDGGMQEESELSKQSPQKIGDDAVLKYSIPEHKALLHVKYSSEY